MTTAIVTDIKVNDEIKSLILRDQELMNIASFIDLTIQQIQEINVKIKDNKLKNWIDEINLNKLLQEKGEQENNLNKAFIKLNERIQAIKKDVELQLQGF